MSRSYASLLLAFLVAGVPSITGLVIAMVMATPLPDLPQNSVTRENPRAGKAEIDARLKKIIDQYKALGNKATAFEEQVAGAAEMLLAGDKNLVLEFSVPPLANPQALNQFKNNLAQTQMNVALFQFKLDTTLEEMDGMKAERAREPRAWQAKHDYVRARLAAQVAQVYEYNAQLGQMRKEALALDKNNQTTWQLVPGGAIMDRDAAKYARKAKTLLSSLARDHATDWGQAAQDELIEVEAGLRWTPKQK